MTTNALQFTPERIARRQRLIEICCAFPEAVATGETHIKFTVRQKTFAYYLFDHHGDGRIALHCKVPLGEQQSFIESDPTRFAVPAYLGAKGWIAFWLDQKTLDWDTVAGLVRISYTLIAPKKLRLLME